jgi:RNA polymerase sporulation-specific sigma factor
MPRDAESGAVAEESWLQDIEEALEVADFQDQQPLPLNPDFAEVIAKARTIFTISEIADIAGVKSRQVHHWASGEHSPQGAARERVLQLFQIVSNLETHLDAERAKVWMWSFQSDLSDAPVNCLKEGRGPEVLYAAKSLSLRDEASDASLVDLAKSGNSSAYEALVRRYRSFAKRKASIYTPLGPDEDDLIQEGLLGLYKAIRNFQTEGNLEFGTFAERCITRQILSAVKATSRTREVDVWISLPPLEGAKRSDTDVYDELEKEAGQAFDDLWRSLVASKLSEFQSRVISFYLDGLSYQQIASALKSDEGSVEKALGESKRRIGQALASRNEAIHSGALKDPPHLEDDVRSKK